VLRQFGAYDRAHPESHRLRQAECDCHEAIQPEKRATSKYCWSIGVCGDIELGNLAPNEVNTNQIGLKDMYFTGHFICDRA